jgi:hypothetical protein
MVDWGPQQREASDPAVFHLRSPSQTTSALRGCNGIPFDLSAKLARQPPSSADGRQFSAAAPTDLEN